MLISMTWCLTFLTCLNVNGQSLDMALANADEASQARAKRTATWIAGPR